MQNNGIATEIYSLINHEEVRPTSNLIISKCTAYEYLNNSTPNIEKLTTQYYETFSITGRFTGYFSNITIGDFYNDLSATFSSPTAILGSLNLTAREESSENSNQNSSQSSSDNNSSKESESSTESSSSSSEESSQATIGADSNKTSESKNVITNPEDLTAGTSSIVGKRGTENFGIAVFKDDKLCGELTAVESMCHLLIQNKVDSCIVSVDNPIHEEETSKVELQIFPKHDSKVNITLENDIPHISIKLDLHADIMTLDKDVDYETNEVLSKISNSTKEYLTKEFNDYLKKVSTEYETDIDNFFTKATANFLTISDWKKFDWNQKFKNAEFDVDINVNVLSTMLITKT